MSWFTDDWDLDNSGYAAAYKDAAIVFVNSDSGEGKHERPPEVGMLLSDMLSQAISLSMAMRGIATT